MTLSITPSHPQINKTLLIVDDVSENITILGAILSPHYKIRVANSGARALAVAKTNPRPDIILLDVMMPEMDGYQVISQLKSDPEFNNIPVIFVTALEAEPEEIRGLQLGAVDYITKPVRPAIVLARVRTQLELQESRIRLQSQNDWLEKEVNLRTRQNAKIQDVSLRALASLAEARDNETGNHILRTQAYMSVLARELSKLPKYSDILTQDVIDNYTKAAPLHDIGKVGIPDHILHKAGKHTAEEWYIMQTHAKIGADAIWRAIRNEEDLLGLEFLNTAMEIAHHHHEKWDGSGYPNGLAENKIPLPARLMALADVFDALISKRVYKPAFTIETATSIILEGRNKHFDPDIVDAYLARLQDFTYIAAQYSDN
jgi:putative two-component system response regulator